MSGRRAAVAVAAGFVAGAAVGFALWSGKLRQSRHGLFSRRSLDRYAALGYLGGRPSVENARLLRDYVRWESNAALRRRGRRLLKQMEGILD